MSVQVPVPLLMRLVAPPVPLPSTAVRFPALLPVSVSVRGPLPVKAVLPTKSIVSATVPDASIVPPFSVSVNNRFVVPNPPVNRNVPPFSTRLAAALLEAPMLLAVPPSCNVATLSTPPLIVVGPV